MRAAIVAGENHQGVVIQALVFERLQNAANVAVQRTDHGGIHAHGVVGNEAQRVIVLARGLQRCMRCVVGQVQEKGPVLVGLDHLDRLVSEVVGHVLGRLKRLAVFEAHGPRLGGPEKFVNWIKVLHGIDHIRVLSWQKHGGTMHVRQRLVEAVVVGAKLRAVPQMPFAQMHGVVVGSLQQFGQCDLAGGQAHVCVGNKFGLTLGVVDGFAQLICRGHTGHGFHELLGRGRELKTKTRGIAPGHHGRPGGCAGGVARIAAAKVNALFGNAVDVGGGHFAARDAAAVMRDVVDAQVVGHNQHHIRGTPLILTLSRPGLPGDFLSGGVILVQDVLDIQQHHARTTTHRVKGQGGQQQQSQHGPSCAFQHEKVLSMF